MTLATTVALPVIRGPVALAKTLGAIDRLSGGRLVVAVGPGSSQQDYDAVGVAIRRSDGRGSTRRSATLRALWRRRAPAVRRAASTRPKASASARARASGRAADLDRELGLGGRARPHRPPG